MPKKAIYTKEQIYNASLEIFKEKGIEGLSARSIANALSSSPAPIYSFYSSLDDLKNELLVYARNLFLEYVQVKRSELKFLDLGMGICIFAREEKKLFNSIFLMNLSNTRDLLLEEFLELIREEVAKDKRFDSFSDSAIKDLINHCWTYAYGFATLIATNYYENISDDEIKDRFLKSAGVIIYNKLEEINN